MIDARIEPTDSRSSALGDEPQGADRAAALRALRSLEATKARLERSVKQEADEARGALVLELLPVLDNLDRMIRSAQVEAKDPALIAGVTMLRAQVENVLHRFGVSRVDSFEQVFDPSQHEAIQIVAVADPRQHGKVLDQAEAGYQFGGKLLRPAKVIVGKLLPGR